MLTLTDMHGNQIEIHLNTPSPHLRTCAVALLEYKKGELLIRKDEAYFYGHQDMSKHYRFGLRWGPGGSK